MAVTGRGDPVENASLVPWLIMVGGLHTNLIYNHSGYSLKTTYLFYCLSFILILYSTFLTRSGILGDTSVHAFTGAGMNQQLLMYLSLFIFIPVFVKANKQGKIVSAAIAVFVCVLSFLLKESYISALWLFTLLGFTIAFGVQLNLDKTIPAIVREENTYSREFWMFIGALVLFLGAAIMIVQTSMPIINQAFGKKFAQAEDVEFFVQPHPGIYCHYYWLAYSGNTVFKIQRHT